MFRSAAETVSPFVPCDNLRAWCVLVIICEERRCEEEFRVEVLEEWLRSWNFPSATTFGRWDARCRGYHDVCDLEVELVGSICEAAAFVFVEGKIFLRCLIARQWLVEVTRRIIFLLRLLCCSD